MSHLIKKKLSEKINDFGVIYFNKNKKNNITRISVNNIKKEFNKKGIILFRNFNLSIDKIGQFTDKFTTTYANDALRRKKRFNKDNIRNVDSGLQKIDLHSEASFSPSTPEIIWFTCITPPNKEGGETIICDGVKLWDSLKLSTKNFFLKNLIKFSLRIPFIDKNKNKKNKKNWYLPHTGVENCIIDFKKSNIEFDYHKYAVNKVRFINRLSFANHLIVTLKSEPQILSRSLSNGEKIPRKIINEIKSKSDSFTYKHNWKKNDLFMIDNNRFLHGREKVSKNDKRDIVVMQTLRANF